MIKRFLFQQHRRPCTAVIHCSLMYSMFWFRGLHAVRHHSCLVSFYFDQPQRQSKCDSVIKMGESFNVGRKFHLSPQRIIFHHRTQSQTWPVSFIQAAGRSKCIIRNACAMSITWDALPFCVTIRWWKRKMQSLDFEHLRAIFFRLCAHFGAVFLTDGKVSNIPLVNVIRIYTQKLEENPAQNCIIPLYNSHDSLISRPMTLQRWNLKHQSRDSIINPFASKNVAYIAGVYTRTWLICLHHALCKCQSSNTEQGEEDKKKVKKELCPVCSAVEACQRFSPTGSSVILSSPCSLKHSGMVRD